MGFFIFIFIITIVYLILRSNYKKKKAEARGEELSYKMDQIQDFHASVTITGLANMYKFAVDKQNKKILFINNISNKLIPFDKIISVELLEDNTILSSKSLLRTVGGGIIGGAIAGGTGAIVGGLSGSNKHEKKVSSVQVKLKLRDISNSSLVIDCFDSKTMTTEGKTSIKPTSMEGYIYKQGLEHATKICDIVSVIIDEVDHQSNNMHIETLNSTSAIDDLEKLVALKEKGVLTDEEFKKMKNSILSPSYPLTQASESSAILDNINDNIPQNIQDAINSGKYILATKLYMDYKHCGMKEAKNYIDTYK